MPTTDPMISTVQDHLYWWGIAYYGWVTLFYAMTVLTIVLPGVIAAGIVKNDQARVLAGISAVLAGVSAWARLDVISANFDVARSDLNRAWVVYYDNHDRGKLETALETAEKMVGEFRPGLPQQAQPKS